VDALIIIDRSTDWVTPMMTMLTYGGLLDEFLGMKNCESMQEMTEVSKTLTKPT
jgi:hypothetical protein